MQHGGASFAGAAWTDPRKSRAVIVAEFSRG